jgi:hypothetical protein
MAPLLGAGPPLMGMTYLDGVQTYKAIWATHHDQSKSKLEQSARFEQSAGPAWSKPRDPVSLSVTAILALAVRG